MKRTPIARKAMKNKPRRTGCDPAACDKYAETHLECLVCERSLFDFGIKAELHHILGSMKGLREDHPANMTMLCSECHRQAAATITGPLTRANVMWLKRVRDPLCW